MAFRPASAMARTSADQNTRRTAAVARTVRASEVRFTGGISMIACKRAVTIAMIRWVRLAAALALLLAGGRSPLAQVHSPAAGDALPAWSPGVLDIHHLATGRGNAAFLRLPDGTTILVDAGDVGPAERAAVASPSAGETIARYVRR